MGILYVVGTPIGNLGDMTYRAVETLKNVDFICAEDTRVTLKLLNHFEIKKPLICYQEHNAAQAGEQILARLLAGENAAIVTDAGMPAISDPGEDLVRAHRGSAGALGGDIGAGHKRAEYLTLSVRGLPFGEQAAEI